ncbi:MAG: hypothetical protein GY757_35860, partial [bacterium]|nr:hypothetical protein [bacterium]
YENDIVTGIVTHNRPLCEDADKILGCFLNSVPLRMQIRGEITWSDYIRSVEEKLVQLKRYDRLPLFEIARQTGDVSQEEGENPIFDTLFNYVDFHIYNQAAGNHGEMEKEAHAGFNVEGHTKTNIPLNFSVNMVAGEPVLSISYDTSIIDEAAGEKIAARFKRVLDKFIKEPQQTIRKDTLLSDTEKHRLLLQYNDTTQHYPTRKTIHRLFEEQVEKKPDSISTIGRAKPVSLLSTLSTLSTQSTQARS